MSLKSLSEEQDAVNMNYTDSPGSGVKDPLGSEQFEGETGRRGETISLCSEYFS